jgi:hypothetical protein
MLLSKLTPVDPIDRVDANVTVSLIRETQFGGLSRSNFPLSRTKNLEFWDNKYIMYAHIYAYSTFLVCTLIGLKSSLYLFVSSTGDIL